VARGSLKLRGVSFAAAVPAIGVESSRRARSVGVIGANVWRIRADAPNARLSRDPSRAATLVCAADGGPDRIYAPEQSTNSSSTGCLTSKAKKTDESLATGHG